MRRGDLQVELYFIEDHGKRNTEDSEEEYAIFHQNNAIVVFVRDSHLRRDILLLLINPMIFLEHFHIDLEL